MPPLRSTLRCGLLLAAVVAFAPVAQADPCGMVPPITPGGNVPIARVGYQQTYVFHKDGLETFVIRPGFTGKVEEFGMLIPFPSVPSLRKVPDATFKHLANAVSPPEVVVDVRPRLYEREMMADGVAMPQSSAGSGGLELKRNEVRVVKQEAVGMYEVTVLQAGSAKALNRWMDDRGYIYPEGMDDACNDYVTQGWCFVAVKTRVGSKEKVDPQPGQRGVDPKLPEGASFDGHVQAMGFRFPVDELVVPMRLSTFNEGDLHNVVYILAEDGLKIDGIPEEYVVRQVSGSALHRNVTGPLPLRIIGGTREQIPEYRRKRLAAERNPDPHMAVAKDLFAGDLLAWKEDRLVHPHEESEKMLLMIGERLMLRGKEIDRLNENSLADQRKEIADESLSLLKKGGWSLSVIDGNFPRELLASRNLSFSDYKMPNRLNTDQFYDAKKKGPQPKQPGVIVEEAVSWNDVEANPGFELGNGVSSDSLSDASVPSGRTPWASLLLLGSVAVFGFVSVRRSRKSLLGLMLLGLSLSAVSVSADEPDVKKVVDLTKLDTLKVIDLLADAQQAEAATEELVSRGEKVVPDLIGEAVEGNDMALRGWAIVALSEIGGEEASSRLEELQNDAQQPMLIRTWSAAARVHMTDDKDELLELAALIPQYPALGRPIGMKLIAKLSSDSDSLTAEDLLAMTLRVPQLQAALGQPILNLGAEPLVGAMATAKDQNVRRQAAGYLATLGSQQKTEVADAVLKQYGFEAGAKDVPWAGGPLFVPGLQWPKEQAKALVTDLIKWHLWADLNNKNEVKAPIHNNLRSINLASAAGYQSPGFQQVDTSQWLTVYGQAYGKDALEKLLKEQKAEEKYKAALDAAK